ncbi:zinc transporter foi [Anopheles stephensi]|uniref:zinc transporter foi n=1 Tax=Anopheles stephensi TaxID=30069 RepID=UPI0007D2B74D|nr:zinc transporter foi [Anopheles stephensi]XP_035905946.1 zinc transporter foi [Anopheles stephensi]XP_035905948.1 zinc transporter foi [Anopheles stephensi]XP_035905949.1 zinc transporter foi [Anopheles stephensi]XP_035905950.1 zinc transporter foi [Anopheles stephensi]XP_035905951.1 zinc transporter foi [Anopheles stephensi]
MVRHFMAVCVVCLLCADHVPCKQHFSDTDDGKPSETAAGRSVTIRDLRPLIGYDLTDIANTYEVVPAGDDWWNGRLDHRIVKRHHHPHNHHHHDDHDDEEEQSTDDTPTEFDRLMKDKMDQAMRKIFTEFGNPASMTMDVHGFERMMRQLGLVRLVSGAATGDSEPRVLDGSGSGGGGGGGSEASESPVLVDSLKCISGNEFLRRVTPPMIRSQEWEDAANSDKSSSTAVEVEKEGSYRATVNGDGTSVDGRTVKQEEEQAAKLILSIDNTQNVGLSNSTTNSSNSSSTSSSTNNTNSNGSISADDQLLVQIAIPEGKINGSAGNESTTTTTASSVRVESTLVLADRDLYNVCPMLLGHLLSSVPQERAGCFGEDSIPPLQVSSLLEQNDPRHHHHHHHHHHDGGSSEAAVWIYSSIAILGVSLCGLLGVVVIPCMEKHFYHHVIQFLVALAIGTLCGDALLHLLPHAMLSSLSNSNAVHDSMMYKGLAAVLGIVFFYFMERFLTVIAEWCKTRQKKDKPPSRVRVMRDPESASLHASSAGEKQCKHKYSSYPYCYDEIAMDTKDDHHEHNNTGTTNENHNSALAKCANHHHNGELSADHNAEYAALNNRQQQPNHTHSHHQSREETNDNNTVSTNLDEAGSIESEQANNHHNSGGRHGSKSSEQTASGKLRPENYTIILREHETKHHGHSHTHGHVHSPPGSLSAVAWMVVMGDGLHNFTDGMTIGAAFANNIAGGFSTAIAVFCHELPHELGDFAVLLKAGMSAREAVYYNLLSSVLSLLGMVLGIVVGHQPEASGWVFAVAAGMFLYIALVDMIPELTSSHGAEERCKTSEFVLQFLGLTLGFSIMMVIAMYEHDLMLLFVD